jgi:hypothetical protein
MAKQERRGFSRSKAWDTTEAILIYQDKMETAIRKMEKITAKVDNIGSKGMFLLTSHKVPIGVPVAFKVDFKSDSDIGPSLQGKGTVLRSGEDGIGIQFDEVDVSRLGECIIWMINHE